MNTKSFFFCIALAFLINVSHAQSSSSSANTMSKNSGQGTMASFNGAWKTDDGKGFSVMNNGYFNSVAQDSTGKWADVHAGRYTVNNDNTITFKILYSSYPDHVGAENTAEYTMNGETIKLRHFKKLIDANGKDMTDQMPKDAYETLMKMK